LEGDLDLNHTAGGGKRGGGVSEVALGAGRQSSDRGGGRTKRLPGGEGGKSKYVVGGEKKNRPAPFDEKTHLAVKASISLFQQKGGGKGPRVWETDAARRKTGIGEQSGGEKKKRGGVRAKAEVRQKTGEKKKG